jgi:hypothetical protein
VRVFRHFEHLPIPLSIPDDHNSELQRLRISSQHRSRAVRPAVSEAAQHSSSIFGRLNPLAQTPPRTRGFLQNRRSGHGRKSSRRKRQRSGR